MAAVAFGYPPLCQTRGVAKLARNRYFQRPFSRHRGAARPVDRGAESGLGVDTDPLSGAGLGEPNRTGPSEGASTTQPWRLGRFDQGLNAPGAAGPPTPCTAQLGRRWVRRSQAECGRISQRAGARSAARSYRASCVVDPFCHCKPEIVATIFILPPRFEQRSKPRLQATIQAERPGVNLNALLDDRQRDPLSGNAVLSGGEVRLAPLPTQESATG